MACQSALLNVFDDIMHMLDGGGSVDIIIIMHLYSTGIQKPAQ